jgi:formylglycine-generating enzyme required for sulfatase activity
LLLGAALLLGHGLLALAQTDPPAKAPVPDRAAQDRAEAVITNLFKDRYEKAKTDAAAAGELATLLLKEGRATTDDPALRFAALSQARDLAARAGNIALALDAVADLTRFYAVDELTLKAAMLTAAAGKATTAEAAQALLGVAFACLDEAVATDNYPPATAVAAAAEQTLPQVKDNRPALAARLKQRAAEVEAARQHFEQVRPFLARLDKDRNDAEASLEVGRYAVISKGDFERGLPLLARGKGGALKALAAQDLANPAGAKEQVALGDAWDALAAAQPPLTRRHLERRAYYWYDQALLQSESLGKTRVGQRHEQLAKQFAAEQQASLLARAVTNSVGMKLARVPAGRFLMGAAAGEQEARDDERPQHAVEITRPFYLGAYPVTQAQYEKVMGTNPSRFKPGTDGLDTKDFPVETVSWLAARDFCAKLSALPAEQAAGRVYRLPTEAEWEYACRAGTTTPFHVGKALASTQANFDGASPYGGAAKGPRLNRPAKVGSYRPNAWGLYDMHGNVWQWCEDRYDAGYYGRSPKQDPRGADVGTSHVMRGGSFLCPGDQCRAAYRISNPPGSTYADGGFRVACVIGAKGP